MFENINWLDIVISVAGYSVLLCTSGIVLEFILSRISKKTYSTKELSKRERDTGFVVGKCENVLIVTFILLDAYTALAIIFAAKAVVRREDMSKNTLFFLAGTMINVTYSIIIGLIVKILIGLV
jgi:hypothetical protein